MFFKHMGYSKIAFWIQHLLHTLFSISLVRIALESCLIYVSSLKKKNNLFHPAFLTIWYTDMKKCTCNSPRHFSRFLAANKKPKLSFPYLFHFHKTHSSPQSSFKMWAFTHTYTPLQLILQWKVLKQFSLSLPWMLLVSFTLKESLNTLIGLKAIQMISAWVLL